MNGGGNEGVTTTDGAGGETTKKKKGKKKKNTDENLHDISKYIFRSKAFLLLGSVRPEGIILTFDLSPLELSYRC